MTAPISPCPDTNGFGRRVLLFAGLLIIFASLAVAAFVVSITKWIPIAFALVGGALIPNAQIANLINTWIKGRGAPTGGAS